MGGSISKAGRKYPKRPEAPSWAGVRTPHLEHPSNERASKIRTPEIEKDAGDPHFLANLNRLGPVRVDHHMQSINSASSETSQLFKSRYESENEASSPLPVHNRLHGIQLSELLDQRKSARSIQNVEQLAEQYGIDVAKLENLARFVNSPSVKSGSATRTVGKDGQEHLTMMAVWAEPQVQK